MSPVAASRAAKELWSAIEPPPQANWHADELWSATGPQPQRTWRPDELWSHGYREWPPPADLIQAVTCFWISVTPPGTGPSVTAVLPDGCSDLIWQSGRGAYVAGPDTGPAPTELPAGTVIVGARFRPGAGGPALGLPLAELRDQRVDLADCRPTLVRQLPADLTPGQALTQVTAIAAQLAATGPPDALVLRGISLLAAGRTTVTGLGLALSLSERQLRRRFERAVGYGPKTVQRVVRFRRLVRHLTAAPERADLASIATRLGYSDQAHLTRETTRLAGLPPAALGKTLRSAASSGGTAGRALARGAASGDATSRRDFSGAVIWSHRNRVARPRVSSVTA